MNAKKSLSLKKYSISDRNILDKKPYTSLKYSNVKPKTDSGFHFEKRAEIEKEILKYYNVRNDEVFRRISLGDLIKLMAAYAEEINLIGLPATYDCKADFEASEKVISKEKETAVENTNHNTQILNSENTGGEVSSSLIQNSHIQQRVLQPFLLLDVRTENDYKECHLATAAWHDRSRLSRAIGWESEEMREYKNKDDKIIVLYDDNEMCSSSVATMLIHRGYSNIFVLSGGLRLAYDKIGYPLVTSDLARELTPEVANFLSEKLKNVTVHSVLCQDAVPSRERKSVFAKHEQTDSKIVTQASKNTQPKRAPWR